MDMLKTLEDIQNLPVLLNIVLTWFYNLIPLFTKTYKFFHKLKGPFTCKKVNNEVLTVLTEVRI